MGHSEMECDSMHSAITTEHKRVGKVNWPADWRTIARTARRKGDKPYNVHKVTHANIIDWKSHLEGHMVIRKDENHKPDIYCFQKISNIKNSLYIQSKIKGFQE